MHKNQRTKKRKIESSRADTRVPVPVLVGISSTCSERANCVCSSRVVGLVGMK